MPYGRAHDNPPATSSVPWPDAKSEALDRRVCYGCHSHETVWPWYRNIAPISCLVQRDMDEGREKLNFSSWGRDKQEIGDAIEVLREGEMPPWNYLSTHLKRACLNGRRKRWHPVLDALLTLSLALSMHVIVIRLGFWNWDTANNSQY